MNDSTVSKQHSSAAAIKKSNKQKLVWGLVCLIGPTALLVLSLLMYALMNFLIASATPEAAITCPNGPDSYLMGACASENRDQSQTFGPQGPVKTIANVILFLTGALSVATWLPGIIAGPILLATRKPLPTQN